MKKQKLTSICAASIGIISSFLPWVTINIFFASKSASGIEGGDGYISLLLFATILTIALVGGVNENYSSKSLISVTIIAGLCILLGFYEIANIRDASKVATIGIGLFLLIFSGIATISTALVLKNK